MLSRSCRQSYLSKNEMCAWFDLWQYFLVPLLRIFAAKAFSYIRRTASALVLPTVSVLVPTRITFQELFATCRSLVGKTGDTTDSSELSSCTGSSDDEAVSETPLFVFRLPSHLHMHSISDAVSLCAVSSPYPASFQSAVCSNYC